MFLFSPKHTLTYNVWDIIRKDSPTPCLLPHWRSFLVGHIYFYASRENKEFKFYLLLFLVMKTTALYKLHFLPSEEVTSGIHANNQLGPHALHDQVGSLNEAYREIKETNVSTVPLRPCF